MRDGGRVKRMKGVNCMVTVETRVLVVSTMSYIHMPNYNVAHSKLLNVHLRIEKIRCACVVQYYLN